MAVQASKQTKKRKRRSYTPEFKAEVVALVEASNKSIGQIARDLDLPDSVVRNWVAAAQKQASPTVARAGLEAENQELRKRIRELEMG